MGKYFAILPDAGCDLADSIRKEYNIDVIHGHYSTPDGEEHQTHLNWDNIDRETFYTELKKDPNGYKTSPPNMEESYEAFKKYASQGIDVLALSISTGLSGSFGFMQKAKEQVLEEYPDAKIFIIDTLRFGPGYGLMAIIASEMRKEGKDVEEVAKWLEDNKNRFHQTGWMDDLAFTAKKGRLTRAKAFMGTLVGIKPIGEFDKNGLTTVIGKLKGEKMAYSVLVDFIAETIIDADKQTIIIATTNRHKNAEEYKRLIEERFHPKKVMICDVFPFCGINIGPGLMAAYYYGKPISEGLEEEKALVARLSENYKG